MGGCAKITSMGKNFKTSIYITGPAIEAYQRLIRRYGAKLAVSAAIIALDQLEATEQLRYIDHASTESAISEKPTHQLKEILHKIAERGVESIEEPIKIQISPSDVQAWEELRKVVEAVRGKKAKRHIGS
jgi:hypothetical protein